MVIKMYISFIVLKYNREKFFNLQIYFELSSEFFGLFSVIKVCLFLQNIHFYDVFSKKNAKLKTNYGRHFLLWFSLFKFETFSTYLFQNILIFLAQNLGIFFITVKICKFVILFNFHSNRFERSFFQISKYKWINFLFLLVKLCT